MLFPFYKDPKNHRMFSADKIIIPPTPASIRPLAGRTQVWLVLGVVYFQVIL